MGVEPEAGAAADEAAAAMLTLERLPYNSEYLISCAVSGQSRAEVPGPRYALFDDNNMHANVALAAEDRSGLVRLCRYILHGLRCRGQGRYRGGRRPFSTLKVSADEEYESEHYQSNLWLAGEVGLVRSDE